MQYQSWLHFPQYLGRRASIPLPRVPRWFTFTWRGRKPGTVCVFAVTRKLVLAVHKLTEWLTLSCRISRGFTTLRTFGAELLDLTQVDCVGSPLRVGVVQICVLRYKSTGNPELSIFFFLKLEYVRNFACFTSRTSATRDGIRRTPKLGPCLEIHTEKVSPCSAEF